MEDMADLPGNFLRNLSLMHQLDNRTHGIQSSLDATRMAYLMAVREGGKEARGTEASQNMLKEIQKMEHVQVSMAAHRLSILRQAAKRLAHETGDSHPLSAHGDDHPARSPSPAASGVGTRQTTQVKKETPQKYTQPSSPPRAAAHSPTPAVERTTTASAVSSVSGSSSPGGSVDVKNEKKRNRYILDAHYPAPLESPQFFTRAPPVAPPTASLEIKHTTRKRPKAKSRPSLNQPGRRHRSILGSGSSSDATPSTAASYEAPRPTPPRFGDEESSICPECGLQDSNGDILKMVCCDRCNRWFHFACVLYMEEPSDDSNWYCKECASAVGE
eukprot:GHVO01053487.1.p1 GENE.GHVO01053487.1~~GHVO01053487.1.p1  ORF type:complete len:340 (+),score=79.45 GHVO01053487.1:32-1021(+)